jgi:UDP-N-acetylglucosamine 4-epimerase
LFGKTYNTNTISLCYYNVFGQKQCPTGAQAAEILLFIKVIRDGVVPTIIGDDGQTKDFTSLENAVKTKINALFASNTAKIRCLM